jgi:hypothetical protein
MWLPGIAITAAYFYFTRKAPVKVPVSQSLFGNSQLFLILKKNDGYFFLLSSIPLGSKWRLVALPWIGRFVVSPQNGEDNSCRPPKCDDKVCAMFRK